MTPKMTYLTVLSFLLHSPFCFAALSPANGFSGEISVSHAQVGEKANLVSGDHPGVIFSQEAHDELWLPLGTLTYTFGAQQDKQWFLGTSRNDIAVGTFVMEGGYRQQLQDGSIWSVSYLPTLVGEPIWKNPYVGATDLELSEAGGDAFRIQIESIAGSPFTLDMAYGTRLISEERSATNITASDTHHYDRNSQFYYAKGSYTLPISDAWTLFPSLIYLIDDAKGRAVRNQGAGAELTALFAYNQHSFATTLSYMNHEFRGHDVIFNRSGRIDEKYSAFLAYEYLSLWNIDALSLISLSGYNATDSSIAFYESADWITTVGMNYAF
ncbi:DUF2860 family protein [Vibrio hangzhouensis]|uniref:DUF2860 domain-containing protein n=1 Tax=Vibrio hangzhouensis TaxID=462991 RepID=A0A1H6BCU3_9VIBR|nr:DUF2860 family protein [Vibrio hangzhouensis]SEG58057.1 Protein of unknown function [Vibrio hangzhouensis]